MKKLIFYSSVLLLGLSSLSADVGVLSYTVPITRNGVTYPMVAYNDWIGEYPKPVIDVKHNQNKWVKIKGYASLRKPLKRKVCSIKTGIYHPWSKDKISLINYYTIAPKVDYIARENIIFDNQHIQKGDMLENEIYIAEGSCSYLLNKKKRITAICIEEALEDSTVFKQVKHPAHPFEQWLYLRCHEGYRVFVQDIDLLRQPNIKKGKISGYGKVRSSSRK
jgi:hypothetical protein